MMQRQKCRVQSYRRKDLIIGKEGHAISVLGQTILADFLQKGATPIWFPNYEKRVNRNFLKICAKVSLASS